MKEILPGVFHWTTVHEQHQIVISSYLLADLGVLLDPRVPADGVEWLRQHGPPRDILLTNRLHYRHSGKLAELFGCTVWCNEAGLEQFDSGQQVKPFRFGDRLPGGIEALEVGALCPDETALLIPLSGGIVAFADGVIRDGDGPLGFVPDEMMGEDPEAVKRGLKAAFRTILHRQFDHLLFAHGEPWVGGGKAALREFVDAA
jgi:hypothetical protein